MSERRGSSLELAILRASREYRKNGTDIVLVKQEPRMSYAGVVGRAPVDFLGCKSHQAGAIRVGQSIAIEAKEVTEARGKSLPIRRLEPSQQSLMGLLHNCGCDVSLICYFAVVDECYRVWWPDIATFLATGWRKSFSLAWFRWNGLMCKQEQRGDQWYVHFDDCDTYPDRKEAYEELEKDQKRKHRPDDQDDEESEEKPYGKDLPGTVNERDQRIRDAAEEGLKNAEERERWRGRPAWKK